MLGVYSINGQLVKLLAAKTMSAGRHAIEFDGANLASGIYFVHLRHGQQTKTIKIALLQ
jgi:hypothetical protein